MLVATSLITLGAIGFERPHWLLAVPVACLLALWIARGSIGAERGGRRTTSLALRCLVLTLVFLCLAEPDLRTRARDVSVVALVDVSDSIPAEAGRRAVGFLEDALRNRKGLDRFGVLTVARDPLVQSLPSSSAPRAEYGYLGSTDATDLESGVRLARALLPPDTGGRIVLVTDGNQSKGEIREAARSLSRAGVPIDVVPVEYDRSGLARIESLTVPPWAREGDTITARVHLSAGRPVTGKLRILLNDQPLDLDPDSASSSTPITLGGGDQVFTVPIKLPDGPVHQLYAVFEPDDVKEAMPQMLSARAAVFTSDRARVLVLSDSEPASAPFAKAIRSENTRVDVLPASEAPTTLSGWAAYDAVVLFNQPSYAMSLQQQEDLVRYVNDTGGGLLMIGGPDAFGAGGWIGSPLAEALPIRLDPPQKRQMPMGALAIIIDRSGSMSAEVQGTGMAQQAIANEAAVLAVRGLSRLDQITIVAFNEQPEIIVPLSSCTDAEGIARRIRSIGAGGGTNLFPAIDEAAAQLAKSPAGAKHIIILTDGQTAGEPADGIGRAANLKKAGITVSTVAIGDASNGGLLERIAKTAGGRSYTVRSENSWAVLPQIFVKEAQTVRRSLIWEGQGFSPKPEYTGDSLRGLAFPLPAVTGYVVSADRPGLATVGLRGPEGDPILAQWQYGLGRAMTFASDAASRWNANWLAWSGFKPFWEQQIKWVARPSGSANARVAVEQQDGKSRVLVDLFDASGDRVDFATMRGRIAHPRGSAEASHDLQFRQVGPGRYVADAPADTEGLHLVSARYEAIDGKGAKLAGSIRAAIERRASAELARPIPDHALLKDVALTTGGRSLDLGATGLDLWSREGVSMPEAVKPIWSHLALALAALFLLDVAVRRVWVDTDRFAKVVRSVIGRAPEVSSAALSTLAQTKARASAQMPRAAASDKPSQPAPAHEVTHPVGPPANSPVLSDPARPAPAPSATPSGEPADMMARLRGARNRIRDDNARQ